LLGYTEGFTLVTHVLGTEVFYEESTVAHYCGMDMGSLYKEWIRMPEGAADVVLPAVLGAASATSVVVYDEGPTVERFVMSHEGISQIPPHLKVLCFRGLERLKTLEGFLFDGCTNIRCLDLGRMPSLEVIGVGFLSSTQSALEELDFSGGRFERLTVIEKNVLFRHQSLQYLSLCNLPKLKRIENNVVKDVPKLKKIVLEDLPSLEIVGSSFLENCCSLSEFSLRSLSRLQELGRSLCADCCNLRNVELVGLPHLIKIGAHSFKSCATLETITLGALPSLKIIGSCFLEHCSALSVLKLQDLPSLEVIEFDFLLACNALESVHMRSLPSLVCIGANFLMDCSKLKNFELCDMPSLEVIESGFLGPSPLAPHTKGCAALKYVMLQNLPRLQSVGKASLIHCRSLQKFVLQALPLLRELGGDLLEGCPVEVHLTVEDVPRVFLWPSRIQEHLQRQASSKKNENDSLQTSLSNRIRRTVDISLEGLTVLSHGNSRSVGGTRNRTTEKARTQAFGK